MNGFGAVATAVVVVIVGFTKFTEGAWISTIAMLSLFLAFTLVHRHYEWFHRRTAVDEGAASSAMPIASPRERSHERIIIPVDDVNAITLNAVRFARELAGTTTVVHVTDDAEAAIAFQERWNRAVPDIAAMVIESPFRAFTAPLLAYIESVEATAQRSEPADKVTIILPTFATAHWWERLLHNRDVLRLKPLLKDKPGVHVIECPYRLHG